MSKNLEGACSPTGPYGGPVLQYQGGSRIETFIVRTACDSREMRKICAEALSGPPSQLSPKLWKIVRAQLLHNFCAKNGAHAQFWRNFSEHPGAQAGSVLHTIPAQFSQPGAIFLKSAAVQDRDVSTQETNQNRKPEPSEGFPETESGTGTAEPFSRNRNRNRNRAFLLHCTEIQKIPFCRGTAGTKNRNCLNRSISKP